jgi:hypothetical protein
LALSFSAFRSECLLPKVLHPEKFAASSFGKRGRRYSSGSEGLTSQPHRCKRFKAKPQMIIWADPFTRPQAENSFPAD